MPDSVIPEDKTKLTKDDLIKCRDALADVIEVIHKAKNKALTDGTIELDQYFEIQTEQLALENQESRLNVRIIAMGLNDLLSTDVTSPKSRIIAATEKLEEATNDLKEFKRFLDTIADVIRLFTTIVTAIQAPSLAAINTILDEIENFGQPA
jgi:hypothetical protein